MIVVVCLARYAPSAVYHQGNSSENLFLDEETFYPGVDEMM